MSRYLRPFFLSGHEEATACFREGLERLFVIESSRSKSTCRSNRRVPPCPPNKRKPLIGSGFLLFGHKSLSKCGASSLFAKCSRPHHHYEYFHFSKRSTAKKNWSLAVSRRLATSLRSVFDHPRGTLGNILQTILKQHFLLARDLPSVPLH